MQGLMSSYPLTLPHIFHRAERLFGDKTITTLTATGMERTTYAEWARAHAPAGGRARRARHLRRRPRGDVRLEHAPATSSSTSPRRAAAASCTRSTSACSPSS